MPRKPKAKVQTPEEEQPANAHILGAGEVVE